MVAPTLSMLTRGVLCSVDALVCVLLEKWHSGEYTAFVEQACLPAEVSTAREAAAVGKSLSRL